MSKQNKQQKYNSNSDKIDDEFRSNVFYTTEHSWYHCGYFQQMSCG